MTVNLTISHAPLPGQPVSLYCHVDGLFARDVRCGDAGFGGAGSDELRFEHGGPLWRLQRITFRGDHQRNTSVAAARARGGGVDGDTHNPWGKRLWGAPVLPREMHQYPAERVRDCVSITFSSCPSPPSAADIAAAVAAGKPPPPLRRGRLARGVETAAGQNGLPAFVLIGAGQCAGMGLERREQNGAGPGDGNRPVYMLQV